MTIVKRIPAYMVISTKFVVRVAVYTVVIAVVASVINKLRGQ